MKTSAMRLIFIAVFFITFVILREYSDWASTLILYAALGWVIGDIAKLVFPE